MVNRVYQAGQAQFQGIIHLMTYRHDFGGAPLPAGIVEKLYTGLQQTRRFYAPAYPEGAGRDSRIPDFRHVLLWAPDVEIGPGAITRLSCYTSDDAGTYRVTVTDSNGCSKTSSTAVAVTNAVGPTISASSNSPVCSSNNLSLTSTPSGGTIPYTAYAWAGPNNYAATQQNPTPFQVFVNASGTYTVTVTDTKNCKATATVSVVVNGPAVAPTSNSPVCPNANILLNAGGTGVTYAWAGPNNFSSNQANPPGFPGLTWR